MNDPVKKSALFFLLLAGFSALLLFQLLSILLIVNETHWTGPVQDFWGSIPYIEKTLASGNWFNSELWLAQNNHRLVLPRLAFLVDYRYFHGSNIFLSVLGIGLVAFEITVLYFLLCAKTATFKNHLIFLAASCVLTIPLVSYNLLHTFNSQWIQCAFLALLSCTLFAKGLEQHSKILFFFGSVAAIACNFTTFTLTAIFPALFLLLVFYHSNIKAIFLFTLLFIIFSGIFIWLLPTANNTGAHYAIKELAIGISQAPVTTLSTALIYYLLQYLSLPDFTTGSLYSTICTVFSLTWFTVYLVISINSQQSLIKKICLAVMFFAICLGLTTALGRAFIGDVALGPRFGPIILLYWCAFWVHLLSCTLDARNKNIFAITACLCLLWIIPVSIGNTINTGKRLSEDHNRFVRPQMAYISGNLDKNAVYENMVPEWRDISYPGIVAALPYLEQQELGIFHDAFVRALHQNANSKDETVCLQLRLIQKPRNDDINIRNIIFKNTDTGRNPPPYLAVYSENELLGTAFIERNNPVPTFFQKTPTTIWIGISKKPLLINNIKVFAYGDKKGFCAAKISE